MTVRTTDILVSLGIAKYKPTGYARNLFTPCVGLSTTSYFQLELGIVKICHVLPSIL